MHYLGWVCCRLAHHWASFFLVSTDYMNYSGFTTTEHGLASSIIESVLQTSPTTCSKLAVKTLKYQDVSGGYFLRASSPFPDFSSRPVSEKLGLHFLRTLECCRAQTKQNPTKIMKLEMGAYFTAHWTTSKKCKLGKNTRLQSAHTVKPMFSWDLKKIPNNKWQFPSHSKAII